MNDNEIAPLEEEKTQSRGVSHARHRMHKRNDLRNHVYSIHKNNRIADSITTAVGSWPFIVAQTFIVLIWIAINSIAKGPFDPFPFILLNLALGLQSAYAAPFVMMSQNRQAERDRAKVEADLATDWESEELLKWLKSEITMLKQITITRDETLQDIRYQLTDLQDVHAKMDKLAENLDIGNARIAGSLTHFWEEIQALKKFATAAERRRLKRNQTRSEHQLKKDEDDDIHLTPET